VDFEYLIEYYFVGEHLNLALTGISGKYIKKNKGEKMNISGYFCVIL